ncbi:MAG: DinB family protein [Planctomycetaceae bacterium]|nr:DinB family protein [Planctomycetaceae bacterium]
MRSMFSYSDWANGMVLSACASLSDAQLDEAVNMGPGTLRRIVTHTYNGEFVWLARWKGQVETAWPSEKVATPVGALATAFEVLRADRERWLAGLDGAALEREQTYRDSRGSLYRAKLGDMLLQGLVHSIHHRAQAVNAIKRVGGPVLEVDYMMRLREPV